MRIVRRIVIVLVATTVLASGMVAASPAWAAGNFALRFSGDTSPQANMVATTASPTLTRDFSVSVDVRWDGTPGYSAAVSLPGQDTAFASRTGMAAGLADGAPFLAMQDSSFTNRVVIADTILQIGQWYTITGTYDGQVVNVYIDGVLSSAQDFGSITDLSSTNGTILIGREFSLSTDPNLNSRGFHGDIDNVAISSGAYPAALTALASYSFSEGAALSTSDAGPSSFTGTLSSTATPEWVQGSDAVPISYQSSVGGGGPVTSFVRPYTPFTYAGAATFTRTGYALTGWTNISTLATVSPGASGVKAPTPETLEAVWTPTGLPATLPVTGVNDSEVLRALILALALFGAGLGTVLVIRRRSTP